MNHLQYYRQYETLSNEECYCPCGEALELDCDVTDEDDRTVCHDCEE